MARKPVVPNSMQIHPRGSSGEICTFSNIILFLYNVDMLFFFIRPTGQTPGRILMHYRAIKIRGITQDQIIKFKI